MADFDYVRKMVNDVPVVITPTEIDVITAEDLCLLGKRNDPCHRGLLFPFGPAHPAVSAVQFRINPSADKRRPPETPILAVRLSRIGERLWTSGWMVRWLCSRGIGKAVAAKFAAACAKAMISSRKAGVLEEAAASIDGEVAWFVANAGEPDDAQAGVEAVLRRFGRCDVLENNAGTNPYYGAMVGISPAQADKTVQVNQRGVLVWTQEAWLQWMADHGGAVVNMSSNSGILAAKGISYYNITKSAVIHPTRQLAVELAPGVRVNAVAPGLVRTDMARALWEADEPALAAATPLRRLGEPDDVAKAVLFLASDASSWITGHTLVIDGGALVRAAA
jgi:NAD(P)-dependent dehydrogenase (short-subunit alcohol dehydrogenase family)